MPGGSSCITILKFLSTTFHQASSHNVTSAILSISQAVSDDDIIWALSTDVATISHVVLLSCHASMFLSSSELVRLRSTDDSSIVNPSSCIVMI